MQVKALGLYPVDSAELLTAFKVTYATVSLASEVDSASMEDGF